MSPDRSALSVGVLVGSVSRNAGGLFNSVRRSALALGAEGCEVAIYGLKDDYSEQDIGDWAPLTPRVFPTLGPPRLGFAPALPRALAQSGHDVLHLHGLWQLLSAQAVAWRKSTGGPLMLSPRGMLDSWALGHSAWKKQIATALFEGENLRGATCLHALNPAEAAAMRAFGLTNPIATIPNGADMPQRMDWAPPDWMAADHRRTLLFLGRLHPKKGLKELLQAWAALKAKSPQTAAHWRLAIAGWDDGGHLAELRAMVDALSLGNDAVFPGALFGDDKQRALANADAFVLPSFSEGLPMSVLEACAYGRAVFMTEACNLSDAFDAGAAVRISTEPQLMAAQLAERLDSPGLAELGRRGQTLVKACYTWTSIAKSHAAVYAWMRDGGQPPSYVSLAQAEQALRRAG